MGRDLSVVSDIRRAARRIRPIFGDGTSALFGTHAATAFIRLGSNLIVSRLFQPEAYGAIAIITSIMYILEMVSDLGLRSFVIRHKTADATALQTVWTIRLIRNFVLTAIMFFGAPVLAGFYSAPEIAPGIRVAAFLFMLGSFTSMSMFTGERERRILRLSAIDFAKVLIVTVVTIVAAYFLRTYWAVIIAMFVGSVYAIIASHQLVPGPPMRLRWSRSDAMDLLRFSQVVVPASLISIVLTQTDRFFMANYFPLAELGKFMLAATITAAILGLHSQYTMRAIYPLVARTQRDNPEDVIKTLYSSRRRYTFIMAFLIGGLIGGGELATRILFNDNYLGAGLYLSILCLQPLGKLMTQPAQQALIAKGFVRSALMSNFLRLTWVLIAGLIAFVQFGPLAVVIVMSLAEAATIPYFWWHQRRFGVLKLSWELLVYVVAAVGAALGFAAMKAADALVAAGYLPSF